MADYIRSPLKWAGGKFRVLSWILPALPRGERLVEPFLGSGVVFLNTDYPFYTLADLNPDIINFFRSIADDGESFISRCAIYFHTSNNQPEAFYALRERFNELEPGAERAALFLYLNRHAFNGLVRYNSAGKFNTPFGRYKKPYFPKKELLAVVAKFRQCKVEFFAQDFKNTFTSLQPGDVVYCDPPYLALSDTAKFTGYTGIVFGEQEQADLAQEALKAQARGCPVLISNHATAESLALYKGARIKCFAVMRSISCKSGTRVGVDELLASYEVSPDARSLVRQ